MKKILLILIVLCSITEAKTPKSKHVEYKYISTKAEFYPAYYKVRKWEGNYGWYKGEGEDSGGETYAGIARNYNKNWVGWDMLDDWKKDSAEYIHHNKLIPRMETHAQGYYVTRWVEFGYDELNKEQQEVANYVFDYQNQGPLAALHIRQVLNNMGFEIKINYEWDKELISTLNEVDPKLFIEQLRLKRVNFYTVTAMNHPVQRKFLKGWLNRVNDI